MTSIRCINSCTKFFKITNARYLGFKRYSDKSDINDENAPRRKKTPHINEVNYSDIIENVPPTYFEYPKPKIHVPPYSKSLLEEWHDDLRHYINYFKDPSKDKAFLRYGIPDHFDIIVIGGGYIGSALGYWLREKHREGQNILVIDKNLEEMPNYGCEPEQIPAAAFLGNFRQQFSIRENIDLAKYSVDFFRRINEHLFIPKEPPIDLPYQPFGHLILSDENGQEMLKASHLLQSNLDIQNELLTPYQLSQRFSWLNTSDIKLACHGMENEGWIDPQALLLAMRCRAMRLGTIFLKAEAVEFIFTDERREFVGFGLDQYRPTNALTVKLPDGKYRTFEFGHCMLALGAETGTFAKEVLFLDERNPGLFSLEVPIERRKRYIFCFEAPEGGPELSSPMIVDQYGLFVKRIGVFDYLCGLAPIPEEEPSADNLDVDYDFFNKRVWPLLANRIPLFENIKLKYGWAYFKDYNTYDGSGIVGRLPAYHNIFMAAGFGEMGIPFSPAIGKALTELLFDGYFTTIDLNRFALRRILKDIYVDEKMLFA